jgi:hypothetical protein
MRLQDPKLSLEETLAWQGWLRANSQHAEAFSRLEEISAAAGRLPVSETVAGRQLAHDTYDGSIPLSHWRYPIRLWRPLAIAASLLLIVGGALWITGSGPFPTPSNLPHGPCQSSIVAIGPSSCSPCLPTFPMSSSVELALKQSLRRIRNSFRIRIWVYSTTVPCPEVTDVQLVTVKIDRSCGPCQHSTTARAEN